jgi:hypothetical protein
MLDAFRQRRPEVVQRDYVTGMLEMLVERDDCIEHETAQEARGSRNEASFPPSAPTSAHSCSLGHVHPRE